MPKKIGLPQRRRPVRCFLQRAHSASVTRLQSQVIPPAAREPSCPLVRLHGGGDVLEGRGCDQTIGDASGMVHLLEGDGVAENQVCGAES